MLKNKELKKKLIKIQEEVEEFSDLKEKYKPIVFEFLLKNEIEFDNETPTVKTKNFQKEEKNEKIELDELMTKKIDLSKYPDLNSASNIIRALSVLKFALDNNIDGLTPPQISRILKEKFRENASSESLSMALNLKNNKKFTDRTEMKTEKRKSYLYRIMKSGENNLKEYMEGDSKND